jgi:hypothetical protein
MLATVNDFTDDRLSDEAPPWFHAALNQALAPITDRLDTIEQNVAVRDQLNRMIEASLKETRTMCSLVG